MSAPRRSDGLSFPVPLRRIPPSAGGRVRPCPPMLRLLSAKLCCGGSPGCCPSPDARHREPPSPRLVALAHDQGLAARPAPWIARCDAIGTAKPLGCLPRRAEIQLVQPHFVISHRIAGIPGDHGLNGSLCFREAATRPQK